MDAAGKFGVPGPMAGTASSVRPSPASARIYWSWTPTRSKDPENHARVAYVVRDGEWVDRDGLPERPVLTLDAPV